MARPSLKTTRSETILSAFMRCVARYGLEGATQERIAAEAGVKRPILRHYLGNREQMVAALIRHMTAQFDGQTEALRAALPADGAVEDLLRLLFGPAGASDAETVLAFQAVVAASERYPAAGPALRGAVARVLALVEETLASGHPGADKAARSATAFAIVSLYVTVDSLAPLAPPETWSQDARSAAETLVASLHGGRHA